MANPYRYLPELRGLVLAYERSWVLVTALVTLTMMWQVQHSPADEASKLGGLGRVTNFEMTDIAGRSHEQSAWRDTKGVVIVFLGIQCPISNGYAQELARLAEYSAARGVGFLGIHGDPDVTTEQATTHARDFGLKFPIILDPEQVTARQVGARTMPEAVVLRPSGEVIYRGRIDDRYASIGRQRVAATRHDLQLAIDAVVANKLPEIAETKAIGCQLPRPSTKN
ncbi:MAG: redoxin domain-containing protein [Planctomycetaceae bacterium]|nr:redoxin domain-containing protein [Planctomycetaceae bacterium]